MEKVIKNKKDLVWKGKEGEKLQKIEYLENEKSFLDEIKTIFRSY